MAEQKMAPEQVQAMISRLKDVAQADVELWEAMTAEDMKEKLEKSRKVGKTISDALDVEVAKKQTLTALFAEKNLELPEAPEVEKTPSQVSAEEHVSSSTTAAGEDPTDKESLQVLWADCQARGRRMLAQAKADRAFNKEMEAVLQEKGIDLPVYS